MRGNGERQRRDRSGKQVAAGMTMQLEIVVAARRLQRMITNRVMVAVEAIGVHPLEPDVMLMKGYITLVIIHRRDGREVVFTKYTPFIYPSSSLERTLNWSEMQHI